MYRRGLLSAVAVGSVAGCSDLDPIDGADPESETEPDDRARIVDHELVRSDVGTDEETVAIEGTVRIDDGELQHVELRGRFYDSDEELLDTTFERLRELEIGTQPFEIRYPEMGTAAAAIDGYDVAITTIV